MARRPRTDLIKRSAERRNSFSIHSTDTIFATAPYSASDSLLKEPSTDPHLPEFLSEPFARLLKQLRTSIFIINTIYITNPDEPCDTVNFNDKNFKDLGSQTLLLRNFVSHCTKNNIAIAFIAPIFRENADHDSKIPQKDAAYSQRKIAFCRQLIGACLECVKDPLSDDPYPFIGITEYPHTDPDFNSICLAEVAAINDAASKVPHRICEEERGDGIFLWSFNLDRKKTLIESHYPHLNFRNPELMGRGAMRAFDDMVFFGQLIKEIGASPEIAKVTPSSRPHSRDNLHLELPTGEEAIGLLQALATASFQEQSPAIAAAVATDASLADSTAPAPTPSALQAATVIGKWKYTSV